MSLRSLVARHHQLLNARDFDALGEVFAEDVEIVTDGRTLRGLEAVVAYSAAIFHAFPHMRIEAVRVVSESEDTIVAEHRILNGDPAGGPLRPQGSGCEIYRVRDGRAVAYRAYYMPESPEAEDVVQVPSRVEESKLAEGQAALQRVATLVAHGVPQEALFAAANEEVGWLVGADATAMLRFEADDTATLVAAWSASGAGFRVGSRGPVDEALRTLREHGRPLRLGARDGPLAAQARTLGLRHTLAVPIMSGGRMWGATIAASAREEPFSDATADRIALFTELVGIALANVQAQADLQALVEEQRGLRRLAVLIAGGAKEAEVLDAVVAETARVLGEDWITLQRFDGEQATIVAAHGAPVPLGVRLPLTPDGVTQRVLESGRPERIDRYAGMRGAELLERYGVHGAVGAPVVVDGRVWGVLGVLSRNEPVQPGTEERLAQFAGLAATAIANAESRAALLASRARVVATADETRRRIERDLHDGAQQRLVHTIVCLKLARRALAGQDGPGVALVEESLEHAQHATEQLRELVHGILPGTLRSGGLRGGLDTLLNQVTLPVTVEVTSARLPEALETTAYFIIAEALTNVVKHAGATGARVTATVTEDTLEVTVSDDGRGGADAERGSGLVGLTDRVAAAGGTIRITSPAGEGTTVAARLPLDGPG